MKKIFTKLLFILAIVPTLLFSQGVTSSSISGRVVGVDGKGALGVLVVAIHEPSNSKYGGRTRTDGTFTINGLRVGGPYTIKSSLMGVGEETKENVYLKLGINTLSFKLNEQKNTIKEVVVSAKSQVARDKTGSETNIGKTQIMAMPTVNRNFNDFTRLTPEANLSSKSDGISIGGQNNRYNSIYIDGAINNDVFGLSESGTNGGQAGVSPFSIDAVESFSVSTSPYDVRQSGFAGGAINAVTKSGTNKIDGSVYYLYRNQDMAGKTANDIDSLRKNLENFNAQTIGFRIGMPLEKDKLFLFTNIEYTKQDKPLPFDYANYIGNSSQSDIEGLAQTLYSKYGYSAGDYLKNTSTLDNWKAIIKLDANLGEKTKASLRYSYNKGTNYNNSNSTSNNTRIVFSNNIVTFPSTTHNLAFELNSQITDNISNNFILGYTNTVDDRTYNGNPFPQVTIFDGSGRITFGSEAFSTINYLRQDIYTLTNNLTINKGKHNLTLGTHNEFYRINNAFVGSAFGSYEFSNLNSFLTNGKPSYFTQTYSLLDKSTNDNTAAAAKFNAMQLGLYIQDEIQMNDKLKLSLGLRVDAPFYTTNTKTNTYFNDSVISKIEANGYDLAGARSGQVPNTSLHFSPRAGFNYDVNGDASLIVRGGTGVFTSRIPFVWIGGMYNNDGLTTGSVPSATSFNPDITSQIPTSTTTRPNSTIDLIEKEFKLPQVWKSSFAIDKKLPYKLSASAEATFSKTLNNAFVENFATYGDKITTGAGSSNDRHYYDKTTDKYFSQYINVIKNTGTGYSWNTSFSIGRNVSEGLSVNAGYSYGVSKVLNEMTSSQNQSNWRYMENTKGRNHLDETYSDFDMGHRVFGSVSFRKEYAKQFASTVSLFFNGQSGKRFSWTAGGNSASKESTSGGSNGTDLAYIPNSQSEINLVDIVDKKGVVTKTAAQQWADLDAYISSNEYLSSRRGQYAERNGDRLPFEFNVDFKFIQEFFIKVGKSKKSFEVSFDVFNITNLINKDWGRKYVLSDDAYKLLTVASNSTSNTTYNFTAPKGDFKSIDNSGINSSIWQGQLGLRYNF